MNTELSRQYAPALAPYELPLRHEDLMLEASRVTGLSNWGGARWGEEQFRHRFAVLCQSLEEEAKLSREGRSRAHSRLYTMLCSRLRYINWRESHSRIQREKIVRPIIGTGMPRAGTTFLHNLLAQDPGNRSAQAWEAAMPVPPRCAQDDGCDERVALYQAILAYQGFTRPELTEIHPFGAAVPEECVFLQEAHCHSLFSSFFNVPEFSSLINCGATEVYQWQIGLMQLLQSDTPMERWTLKAPAHLFYWKDMLLSFPDALVYVNHRDPSKVVASMGSLFVRMRGLFSSDDGIDLQEIGRLQLLVWSKAMNNLIRWRSEDQADNVVLDIHFLDLIAQPVETVKRMYDEFGIRFPAGLSDRIEQFLEHDHHGKSPKRKYGLADYGLTIDDIEANFKHYIDHYGIVRESRA